MFVNAALKLRWPAENLFSSGVWNQSRRCCVMERLSPEGVFASVLGRLRGILRATWSILGASWTRLGGVLEASWGHLGGLLGVLDASWKRLGASWARLGASWGQLGASWRRLGGVLEASWAILEASWRHLGLSKGVLEASWAEKAAILAASIENGAGVRRMRVGLSKGRYLPFMSFNPEHALAPWHAGQGLADCQRLRRSPPAPFFFRLS